MKHFHFRNGLMMVLLTLLAAGSLYSQYMIKSSVFASGGGQAIGSNARIKGTVGQTLIGPAEGTGQSGSALAGFWYTEQSFTSAVEAGNQNLPAEFRLEQNYPNPFNPTTTIVFCLPKTSQVHLEIYNVSGERICPLIQGRTYEAGRWEATWDGRDSRGNPVSSGFYIYRITAGEFTRTRKMALIK